MVEIRNVDNIESISGTCGPVKPLYSSSDLSVAHVTIHKREQPHMHKGTEEIYYVLKGNGVLYIDKDEGHDIRKGDIISIPKGKYHTTEPSFSFLGHDLELLVICHPKFDLSDVHHKQK